MLIFPNFNPIAFSLGSLKVHWYGLAYAVGVILGWRYAVFLTKHYVPAFSAKILDNFVTWALIGIIAGGRLGHVFFYDLGYYLDHPAEIIMTWKGGMSFHGGLLGVTIVTILYCRRFSLPLLKFSDVLAAAAPIGLGLGRFTNFINQELYGKVTDVPWSVFFPKAGPLPRHPTQLYEALGEGLFLWILLAWAWRTPQWRHQPGRITGLFLFGYGVVRFLVEFWREPEILYPVVTMVITQGQLLSLPLVLLGGYWLKRRPV